MSGVPWLFMLFQRYFLGYFCGRPFVNNGTLFCEWLPLLAFCKRGTKGKHNWLSLIRGLAPCRFPGEFLDGFQQNQIQSVMKGEFVLPDC